MKPIDEKLAKLANKAEIKVNDRSKEEKQAYDKGFVTGVLSIALEFELDKEEVASFLEERRELTKAIELLESKRPHGKWIPNDTLFHHGKTSWRCSVCNDVIDDVPTCMNKPLYKFCPNCGAEMEADNETDN